MKDYKVKFKSNKMKKIYVSALLLAGLVFNKVNAQQGFSVSVKGTPQFSFLHNKDDNNNPNYSTKATVDASFGLGAGTGLTTI